MFQKQLLCPFISYYSFQKFYRWGPVQLKKIQDIISMIHQLPLQKTQDSVSGTTLFIDQFKILLTKIHLENQRLPMFS